MLSLPIKKDRPFILSMDLPWVEISNAVHTVEQMNITLPSSKSILIAGAVGIPLAVLLHDTSDRWLPTSFKIPILSFFQRKWAQDPQEKKTHLRIFRNALIFGWIVCALQEGDPKFQPLDYVIERVSSTTARKSLSRDISEARKAAFGATHQVVGESALDEANARQQRDAALRRRHSQELRRPSKE
jgi:hypothetical protein